jgi:preprotein translocase subunit SecD
MDRGWWWRATGIGLLTLLAVIYLLPSMIPRDRLEKSLASLEKIDPAARSIPQRVEHWAVDWALHRAKKITLGLDLQGGLHLVYEVDIDKAISDKIERLGGDIADRLKKEKKVDAVTETVERGERQVTITMKNVGDLDKVDAKVMEGMDELVETNRDKGKGRVTFALSDEEIAKIQKYAIEQSVQTIRNRVDKLGVAEPNIVPKGNTVVVEMPGAKQDDFERIKRLIGTPAQLEFKIVDDELGNKYFEKIRDKLPKDITFGYDTFDGRSRGTIREAYLRAKKKEELEAFFKGLPTDLQVPKDHAIGYEQVRDGDSEAKTPSKAWRTLYLRKRADLTGEYLRDATQQWDPQTNRPEVGLEFDHTGGAIFAEVSGKNIGRKMAILLDDKVNSAPVLQDRIAGGRARITLGYQDPLQLDREARDLVTVLRSGALPAPLRKTYESQIGPTLGGDSVKRGFMSLGIGLATVALFMIVYYRIGGLAADFALIVNAIYILSILAGLEATLTVPGIAGILLTIGMAVDANIIINERIREELRNGKSPRAAVEVGFDRAFTTIIDSHMTNLIAGLVLLQYGTGPLRGFAVTLIIGVFTSVFTGVWVARLIQDWQVAKLTGNRLSI